MEECKKITKLKILVVDDDSNFLSEMKNILSSEFDVTTITSARSAMGLLYKENYNLVLLDYEMPEMSGFEFLKLLQQRYSEVPVIMLTGYSDSEIIINTMQAGANNYVVKGCDDFEAKLKYRIAMALEKTAIVKLNQKLSEKLQSQLSIFEIVGASRLTMKLKSEILKLKGSSASVLITGESGTGKELIARNLNLQEGDLSRPFIAINCAAMTSSLFESELFGHVKGAFTGATETKIGKFQAADGGDIFLDEIGELTPELQAKLLRVLQLKVITQVGSNIEIPINVRIIVATNRNLELEISQGRFREDLYYRINRIIICSPPLRERKDDIILIAETVLKRTAPMFKFSSEAKKILLNNSWPGNIRDLENIIERAIINAKADNSPVIKVAHLTITKSDVKLIKNSLHALDPFLPQTEKEISSKGLLACMNWAERTYIEQCLELMKNDNQALYSKFNISKAYYFKRKKAIGLTTEVEEPV
jgi:DNA-binding NtrC family response regulator